MNLEIEEIKKFMVVEKISIPRPTVQALLEVVEHQLKRKPTPQKITYVKGEDLLVERMLSKNIIEGETSFTTPYQIIRQYAEISIVQASGHPFKDILKANSILNSQSCKTSYIVCLDRDSIPIIPEGFNISGALQVPLLEDPECPEGCLFICGSSIPDPTINDIEHSVLIRE